MANFVFMCVLGSLFRNVLTKWSQFDWANYSTHRLGRVQKILALVNAWFVADDISTFWYLYKVNNEDPSKMFKVYEMKVHLMGQNI